MKEILQAPTRSSTEKSYCSPVERPERLPYVKKLLSQDSSGSLHDPCPITPPHLKKEQTFQPRPFIKPAVMQFLFSVLTPKSHALLQKQVNKKSAIKNRRVSEPLARKPKTFWSNPGVVCLRRSKSGCFALSNGRLIGHENNRVAFGE